MKIKILTTFPEMFDSVLSASILGRAREQGLLDVSLVDIRPFSDRKHKNTDDYPFGGGAGMVMLAQPIRDAMAFAMGDSFRGRRIYLGPRGQTLTTEKARALAAEEELILLCGHYEGVDQRALDTLIDEEISIGDYILTGGELAAMVLTDCVSRFIPQYTRPRVWEGQEVPEVLLGGNHAEIRAWRRRESLRATLLHRPDLLEKAPLSPGDLKMLKELSAECSCEK